METLNLKIERPLSEEEKIASEILLTLQKAGYESYFVGGGVRDELMGNPTRDIDLATQAKPEEIERLFSCVYDRGKKFGVMAVQSGEYEFEVATFRNDIGILDHRRPEKVEFTSAENDAKRRDFTINGLFYDPEKSQIFDWVGGLRDLKDKIIRFIGDPEKRIAEDYLRMLRAVRFANRFNFSLEEKSKEAIIKNAPKIKEVSVERIAQELTKMLVDKNRVKSLEMLFDLKLLAQILPEIEELKGVQQPVEFHSEGDVWTHTLLALEKLNNPSPELVWTVLFHDIGKPQTQGFRDHPKSKITFFEHDVISAEMAEKILKRLKFSNDFIDGCVWAISQHMRIIHAFSGMSERKQLKLFTHPHIDLLLNLTQVDLGSSIRPSGQPEMKMYEDAIQKRHNFQKQKETTEKNQVKKFTLITGNDIINILKIPAGPKVGEIKTKIEEKFLEGKISTRDEALKMIKEQKDE